MTPALVELLFWLALPGAIVCDDPSVIEHKVLPRELRSAKDKR